MSLPLNPFVQRLARYLDAQVLRSRLAASAPPIASLGHLPARSAKDVLERHLAPVYAPTIPGVQLAMRILSTGLAHALQAYPDLRTYVTTATQARIKVTPEPVVWLTTGLAGDGKSALATALFRLLGEGEYFEAPAQCPRRRIRGGILLTMHAKTTKAELVAQLAAQLELDIDCGKVQPVHFEQIQLELYRQGCCFILADEAQSNDAGKRVGAAYVNLINLLRRFGVPVIVVGNYSMCHGLLKQHSQNRQRFLNDPYILPTLAFDDPDYIAHLRAYQTALGAIFAIDPEKDAGRIHWLTAGGGRALLHLIGIAYCLAREGGTSARVRIDLASLERAYDDRGYFVHRKEVEELRAHWRTGAKISEDLLCPFPATGDSAQDQKRLGQQLRREALAAGTLVGSMSPSERKRIASGEVAPPQFASSQATPQAVQRATATPAPPATATTAPPIFSSNSVGANVLQDAIAPKRRAVRRPPPSMEDLKRSWGR